jgi:hypothetical protein
LSPDNAGDNDKPAFGLKWWGQINAKNGVVSILDWDSGSGFGPAGRYGPERGSRHAGDYAADLGRLDPEW